MREGEGCLCVRDRGKTVLGHRKASSCVCYLERREVGCWPGMISEGKWIERVLSNVVRECDPKDFLLVEKHSRAT